MIDLVRPSCPTGHHVHPAPRQEGVRGGAGAARPVPGPRPASHLERPSGLVDYEKTGEPIEDAEDDARSKGPRCGFI